MNPLLNRWVSADPLAVHALGADPNLYAYVSGRVLQSVDPLGLESASTDQIKVYKAGIASHRAALADAGMSTRYVDVIMKKAEFRKFDKETGTVNGSHRVIYALGSVKGREGHDSPVSRHSFSFTRSVVTDGGYQETITHEFTHAIIHAVFGEREFNYYGVILKNTRLVNGKTVGSLPFGDGGRDSVVNEVSARYLTKVVSAAEFAISGMKALDPKSAFYKDQVRGLRMTYKAMRRAAAEMEGYTGNSQGSVEVARGQVMPSSLRNQLDGIASRMIGVDQRRKDRLPTFGDLKRHAEERKKEPEVAGEGKAK